LSACGLVWDGERTRASRLSLHELEHRFQIGIPQGQIVGLRQRLGAFSEQATNPSWSPSKSLVRTRSASPISSSLVCAAAIATISPNCPWTHQAGMAADPAARRSANQSRRTSAARKKAMLLPKGAQACQPIPGDPINALGAAILQDVPHDEEVFLIANMQGNCYVFTTFSKGWQEMER